MTESKEFVTSLDSKYTVEITVRTEDGEVKAINPLGVPCQVIYGGDWQPEGGPEYLEGIEIREKRADSIANWPTQPGNYIVNEEVAQVATSLGLTVPGGNVYTQGPATSSRTDEPKCFRPRLYLVCWPWLSGPALSETEQTETPASEASKTE